MKHVHDYKMDAILLMVSSMFLFSCGQGSKAGETKNDAATQIHYNAPQFNADSAYRFTDAQVKFGPRVPNTEAHDRCAAYLENQLRTFGAKIYIQDAMLATYDGTKLKNRNIIGSYNPDSSERILLCAHWDSRPFADHDPDSTNWHKPILAADDGASGVAVLLEIARQMGMKAPEKGIDIVLFDCEDWGAPDFAGNVKEDSWCLGSQFWSKHPHIAGYKAEFGILLDMVGGRNATFYKEFFSLKHAAPYVEQVWSKARELGFTDRFLNEEGGAITDDHEQVIKNLHIPCIDIINTDPNSQTGFVSYWHTAADDMGNIDQTTLKAVGQTVMEVIYSKE